MPDIKSELQRIAPVLAKSGFDDDGGAPETTVIEPPPRHSHGELQRTIMLFVEYNPGSTSEEIAHAAGRPVDGFGSSLKRLLDKGAITRTKHGREYRYYVETQEPKESAPPTPAAPVKPPKEAVHPNEVQVGGSHYKDMALQPWDVMEIMLTPAEFIGFLKGNVIKYSMRQGRKAGANDDGLKAVHYKEKLESFIKERGL